MQDHTEIVELERRISAALARIDAGVEALTVAQAGVVAVEAISIASVDPVERADLAAEALAAKDAEISRLRAALEAEKATSAQLAEKLKPVRDRERERENLSPSQMEAKVDKMTRQLDVQGLELQRMRKSTMQLREHLRVLHEAAAEGMAEPHLINKAMLAELESLRATRHTETAEMDEILAELVPLIEEARAHG